jgi:CSLREA domain-containing protein
MRRIRKFLVVAPCFGCIPFSAPVWLILATLGGDGIAFGATFDVNTTADGLDTLPGDGICQSVGSLCTLRAAIMEANSLPGPDIIQLRIAGTYLLSIPGQGEDAAALGDLDVTDDVQISAGTPVACIPTPTKPCPKPPSFVIDGNHLDRVFHIHPGATVSIGFVTIQNGDLYEDGGGIRNEGELMLGAVTTNNQTFGSGGGIYNAADATLTLFGGAVRNNIAAKTGGGIDNFGGTVQLFGSSISNNRAGNGGGLASSTSGGNMIVWNSTISGNLATQSQLGGGGVLNDLGSLTLGNSTISGNSAPRGGGAANFGGTVFSVNSTVTENEAGDTGGGLLNVGVGVEPSLYKGIVWLVNTIIARNVSGDCSNNASAAFINSLGHNLDGDGSCNLTAAGDLPGVANPLLGPLQDNGGETLTHALLSGSPAIDAGDSTACPSADQRFTPRPQGNGCDIGAYEYGVRR